MKFLDKLFTPKKYSLVISWWWVRWFYGLWVLKALEESGIKDQINVIYWVSAGAILATYRSAGYSADWIFERFTKISVFGLKTINVIPKKSLLKNNFVHDIFVEDLPKDFKELKIPVCIWATDVGKWKYIVYKKWNLTTPLLGSMTIPAVFPAISYEWRTLMDGGLINNFPVDLAKKDHPKNRIIWIFLNKFVEDQKTDTIINALWLSYDIFTRARDIDKLDIVDDLFYRDLKLPILSNNKKRMKEIFEMGYKDWIEKFWK